MKITLVSKALALTMTASAFAQDAAQANAERSNATSPAAEPQGRAAGNVNYTHKPVTNTGHQPELL